MIDACNSSAYVPVVVQEKVPSPLKDIAIYRLQRVEKALKRLGAAVDRLEGAATAIELPAEVDSSVQSGNGQLNFLQTELESVKADYNRLRIAATQVADRLDQTIETLDTSGAGDTSESVKDSSIHAQGAPG